MIALLLGTCPAPFDRLLNAVDRWAGSSGERVVAQVGETQLPAPHCECHRILPEPELIGIVAEARVAVCHGGFGSIRLALAAGTAVVAVPREGVEAVNAQGELVDALAAEGLVMGLRNLDRLPEALASACPPAGGARRACAIPSLLAEAVAEAMPPGRRS